MSFYKNAVMPENKFSHVIFYQNKFSFHVFLQVIVLENLTLFYLLFYYDVVSFLFEIHFDLDLRLAVITRQIWK